MWTLDKNKLWRDMADDSEHGSNLILILTLSSPNRTHPLLNYQLKPWLHDSMGSNQLPLMKWER